MIAIESHSITRCFSSIYLDLQIAGDFGGLGNLLF